VRDYDKILKHGGKSRPLWALKNPAQTKTENSDFLRLYGKNIGRTCFWKKIMA